MLHTRLVLWSLLCLSAIPSTWAAQTGHFKLTLKDDPGQEYWMKVPGDYKPERKYPLLFSIHGSGGNGQHFATMWNPDGTALDGGRKLSGSEYIVVAPTFNHGNWTRSEQATGKKIDAILDEVFAAYSIDTSNVYLNGFSAGGACAWTYLWLYQDRKAPKSPFTGGVFLTGANCWSMIVPDKRYPLDLPWFIEVGDGEWNLANLGPDGVAAEANLKKAGYRSVVFHKIEGQGHSIGPKAKKLIFEWLYDQLHRVERARLAEFKPKLDAAAKAADAQRFAEVFKLTEDALNLPADAPEVKQALELRAKIEAEARTALESAEAQAKQGQHATAIAAFREASKRFQGLPTGQQAQDRMNALVNDPAIKAGVAKQEAEASAEAALTQARKFEADKAYLRALEVYDKVVQAYPDTAHAKSAAEAAAKIRADKTLMASLETKASERDAIRKLKTAKNYLANGLKDQARPVLEDLIQNHAGTEAAEEAKRLLKS
ncbi:MAG: hypothetical protein AMXMBFR7_11240 [Planctomycetota bacterium]